jgi:quinol monooxygenase YgiN
MEQTPVMVLNLRMVIAESLREEVVRILRSLVGPAEANPSCVNCEILEDLGNPCGLTFREGWTSVKDFEGHLNRYQLRKLLEVMDLSEEEPEIRFDSISRSEGIERIASLLGRNRQGSDNERVEPSL